MRKSANAIIRQEAWAKIVASVPPDMAKKFKKALIDSDSTATQALMAFVYAVATGQIVIEPKPECLEFRGQGMVYDKTGVFDDYRVLLKDPSGRILNPIPFTNKFIEKI